MKRLTEYLEEIGREIHSKSHVDITGTIRVRDISKEEALAREVWQRALGFEKEVINEDGSVSHRVSPPDPKMQMFIFERLEGKNVQPPEDKKASLVKKITDMTIANLNKMAEEVTDDTDASQSDAE